MYFTKPPFFARHLLKKTIWNIPTEESIIYLTFDDGPTPEITEWVLEILKKHNAKATFFCIGKNIEMYPGIFKKIIAENHSTGNHTHQHLNGWKIPTEKYIQDVKKCGEVMNIQYSEFENKNSNTSIRSNWVTGNLFRPPYGKIRQSQISNLKLQYKIIMWDVLSGDFDQKISGERCFNNVVKNVKNGSIVVFHDSIKAKNNLFYALPKVLEFYSENGFRFEKLNFTGC